MAALLGLVAAIPVGIAQFTRSNTTIVIAVRTIKHTFHAVAQFFLSENAVTVTIKAVECSHSDQLVRPVVLSRISDVFASRIISCVMSACAVLCMLHLMARDLVVAVAIQPVKRTHIILHNIMARQSPVLMAVVVIVSAMVSQCAAADCDG